MVNAVQANLPIWISTVRVVQSATCDTVGCPVAPMGSSRPNNQRVEMPIVHRW
jgi:hypothetical protein